MFLSGSAVENLINPDRIIIGNLLNNKNSLIAAKIMRKIYTKWIPEEKIILVDSNTSELSKLISNAFLGQRISSINSISSLCESTNSDINRLALTVGSDSRIGNNFLKASMGFGGSCLKKDILSLVYILSSRNMDLEAQYWANVILINEYQRLRICNIILKLYEKIKEKNLSFIKFNEENLKEKELKVNIFGLSFKGNTNDVRGSNTVFLVNFLMKNNIFINLFDPFVKKEDFENELKLFNQKLEHEEIIKYINYFTQEDYYINVNSAFEISPINIFCNDHKEFKNLKIENYKKANLVDYKGLNEDRYIFDLYDVFDIENVKQANFKVYKIGVIDETNK